MLEHGGPDRYYRDDPDRANLDWRSGADGEKHPDLREGIRLGQQTRHEIEDGSAVAHNTNNWNFGVYRDRIGAAWAA